MVAVDNDRVCDGFDLAFLTAVQDLVSQHALNLRCVVRVDSELTRNLLNVSHDCVSIAGGESRAEIWRLFQRAFLHQLEAVFL